MKLTNLQKSLLIYFFVFLALVIGTLLWNKIYLNISNVTDAVGNITKKNYSTDADTLRYVMFVSLPILVYFFLNIILRKDELINFKELFKDNENKIYTDDKSIHILIIIFIIFIIFEFLSLNLPDGLIDTFHDGEVLVPAQNYFLKQGSFISSYTVHGGSDIFYPVLAWKIFDSETVGAGRMFFLILILLLKFSTIFLSYQITKITKLHFIIAILLIFKLTGVNQYFE